MKGRFHQAGLFVAILIAISWMLYFLSAEQLSQWVGNHYGAVLSRIGGGKFDDPALFVKGRIREIVFLSTMAALLGYPGIAINRWLKRKQAWLPARGIIMGTLIFILANAFAWCAGQTVLFWTLFYNKTQVDNFAQYEIKSALLREMPQRRHAILIGNSQTNTNIDEVLMNRMIGGRLWTTELSQPGASPFDLLTLSRNMPLVKGDIIICYLSEIYFYGDGNAGGVPADFFGFSEIPDVHSLKGWNLFPKGAIRSGLIGRLLPIYRYRNSLSHRILGWQIVNLKQYEFDASLETDLEEQARRRAPKLKMGRFSRFQQASLAAAVAELSTRGCTTILIAGNTHPKLQKHMNPRVREDMTAYLERLRVAGKGNVIVVEGSEFFTPKDSDFLDLVHFSKPSQERFTRLLIPYLESIISKTAK